MQRNPDVTVATITYNSSKYIQYAIESVLYQSYKNFELLIIDDCSPDNTWDIIKRYNDPRIRAYRNESNLGENGNRNKAIELAKGEYFIFIDGDDMIYPHGLEFMTKMLYAFPECGIALMYWFKNNMFWPVILKPRDFYIGEYFGNGFLGTAFTNILFKTRILREEGGISNKYLSADDDYIRYKIALKHNCLIINDNLTWWRETPGQAFQKHSQSDTAYLDSILIRLEMLENPDCPFNSIEIEKARFNLYTSCYKYIIRLLISRKFKIVLKILKVVKPPLKFLLKFYKKPINISPFPDNTPIAPLMIPFNRNPYSSNFNSI